jgi:hypothetical protein
LYIYIKSNFRYDLAQALYVGEKSIILPLLEWLLKERELLEKRAYLGKYLMKIEVPAALRGDSNFEELYENVRQLQRGLSGAPPEETKAKNTHHAGRSCCNGTFAKETLLSTPKHTAN